MSGLVLVLLVVVAGMSGLLGGLAPLLYRRLRRHTGAASPGQACSDLLSPQLKAQLHQLSADWAVRSGQPAAAPLAAGYLIDALRDVQRRLGGHR